MGKGEVCLKISIFQERGTTGPEDFELIPGLLGEEEIRGPYSIFGEPHSVLLHSLVGNIKRSLLKGDMAGKV